VLADAALADCIKPIHMATDGIIGASRICVAICEAHGIHVARKRAEDLCANGGT